MRAALAALLVLPLALVACGGDSKDASTNGSSTTTASTTGTTSGDGYVAAGNQVCIRADKRIFAIGRLSRDPKGWQRTATVAKQAIVDMKKVEPPPARAAAFQQMLRYGNALALSIQEVHHALVSKDYDTAAAAQLAAGQLQDRVHAAAKDAGLTFCQQSLTNWPA
jgi:hypothetical protein